MGIHTSKPPFILLLEGSDPNAKLIEIALDEKALPVKLMWIKHQHEAIDYLRTHAQQARLPDLILMGLNINELGNFKLLSLIREELRLTLPVVVLSSTDLPDYVEKSYELGASEFVTRELDFDAFSEQVAQLLQKHLAL